MPRAALAEWTTFFEAVGLKAAELPKVLGAARVAAGCCRAAQDVTMSVEDLEKAEKNLDNQVKASTATTATRRRGEEALEDQATALRNDTTSSASAAGRRGAPTPARSRTEDQAWREYCNWLGERRMEDEDRTQSFRERFSSAMISAR